MAARRVGQKALDWADFAQRVPASHKAKFFALKARSDALKARLSTLPEATPDIKWDAFKQKVPVAGLVDDFQKKFAAVKVPYPVENETPKIDGKEKEMTEASKTLVAESNKRIVELKKELEKLQNLIPFEEMTDEEFEAAFPGSTCTDPQSPYYPYFNFRENP